MNPIPSDKTNIVSMASRPDIALPWLVRLRWGYIGCQILLIDLVILAFDINAPVQLIIVILGFEIISNGALHFLHQRATSVSIRVIAGIFLLDSVFLTALLFTTGGSMNPFTFLYLVHVVLGAIILPGKWAWWLSLWTCFCYLLLFIPVTETVIPLPGADFLLSGPICHLVTDVVGPFSLHLQGMWAAFTVTVIFIVYFVGKIQTALAGQQEMEQALREEKMRSEQLASLATLAAGAAHELSTPLGTIAVASGELLHELGDSGSDYVREDLQLIREEVGACKEILYQMAAGAGEHRGEESIPFILEDAWQQIMQSLSREGRDRVETQFEPNLDKQELVMPFRTFQRTVSSLVQNGLEASETLEPVKARWYEEGDYLCLEITDQGKGMDSETLRQATIPFFTSKDSGLGLGLFLAKTMADRFDGHLDIQSEPGSGTVVLLQLKTKRIIGKCR